MQNLGNRRSVQKCAQKAESNVLNAVLRMRTDKSEIMRHGSDHYLLKGCTRMLRTQV